MGILMHMNVFIYITLGVLELWPDAPELLLCPLKLVSQVSVASLQHILLPVKTVGLVLLDHKIMKAD